MQGCNLACPWCDTKYASSLNDINAFSHYNVDNLISTICSYKNHSHICITGGEPLLQNEALLLLLHKLSSVNTIHSIVIQTNGTLDIKPFFLPKVIIAMDYKTESSGFTDKMLNKNLISLREQDEIKFVIADAKDFEASIALQQKYDIHANFYAIDWLARLTIHIPNKGEQMVKYYGYYSNKSRGLRKKEEQRFKEGKTETIQYSNIIRKKFNKKWARLIQKVYNVDPLICPKCSGKMRIISFIEEEPLIKKILKHLKLWIVHNDDSLNKSPPQKILDIINNNPIESPSRYNSVGTHTNTTLFNSQEFVAVMQMPYEDEYSQLVPYDD